MDNKNARVSRKKGVNKHGECILRQLSLATEWLIWPICHGHGGLWSWEVIEMVPQQEIGLGWVDKTLFSFADKVLPLSVISHFSFTYLYTGVPLSWRYHRISETLSVESDIVRLHGMYTVSPATASNENTSAAMTWGENKTCLSNMQWYWINVVSTVELISRV